MTSPSRGWVICIRCGQKHSDPDHQCLDEMTIEELYEQSLREVRERAGEIRDEEGEE